jgi:hypothetical protein
MGVAFVEEEIAIPAPVPYLGVPFQVALPTKVGAGLAIIRISSPGAIRAAVAPLVNVFQRRANVVPLLVSFPPSKSK